MPKNRKKPTMDEIIYGDGYIIEKGFNPLKKKKIKIFRTSPEQKKEFLIKNKQIQRAKSGRVIQKPKNPSVANKVVDEIVKSKKYSYVKRAMNPKSPTIDNQTMRTMGADGKLFPTIRRDKRGRLREYDSKVARKMAEKRGDAIPLTDIAPTYVSTKDVSLALSDRVGEARGKPPKRGPNPQGIKNGQEIKIGKGLKFRASGDVSYQKKIKPRTDVKVTYNTKKKKIKEANLRTVIGDGVLNIGKDKYSTTANYSKNLLGGTLGVSAYKRNKDKGFGASFTIKYKSGNMVNSGCPYRENGVKGSDIKGVKPIQVKGKKFIGVK